MKRLIIPLLLSAIALSLAPAATYADGGKMRYATSKEVSLEDIFFSRIIERIHHSDSTMQAAPVVVPQGFDAKARSAALHGFGLGGEATGMTATATWRDAMALFLSTHDVRYADIAERALYNGVIAEADSSRTGSAGWREAAQAIHDAPYASYAMQGHDLWVNYYIRTNALIRTDSLDIAVIENTSAPWYPDAFFSFSFDGPASTMTLHLRLPAWMRDAVTPEPTFTCSSSRQFYQVTLNGKLLQLRAGEDGYLTIGGLAPGKYTLRLTMENKVKRIRAVKGHKGRFAVQQGPIVYAQTNRDKKYYSPEAAFGNNYDRDVLHTNELVTKVYSKPRIAGQSPWEAVLLPYYITFGDKSKPGELWLREIKK